jgi:hypothetical protein
MKKFYWGILVVGFLYGCSSLQTNELPIPEGDPPSPTVPRPKSVISTIVDPSPVPRSEPAISDEVVRAPVSPSEPNEAGKAAIEILCKKGYLSPEDC